MPSAGVVIIGNEILTGKFADENGPFLIRRLRALGSELGRLAVISDELDAIADEVRRCSAAYDIVFTTGGVGPTHDDVTLEGIAQAFDRPLVRCEPLVALLEHFKLPIDDATMRMAMVPEGTELLAAEGSNYPVLRCENVWIFPGVPKLMRLKFEAVAEHFRGPEIHTARIYVTERESRIASTLTEIAAQHPAVDIGSYPRFDETDFQVILTLESTDPRALESAEAALREVMPVRT